MCLGRCQVGAVETLAVPAPAPAAAVIKQSLFHLSVMHAGPCGDNYQGMTTDFASLVTPIQASYTQGAAIELKVYLTSNHGVCRCRTRWLMCVRSQRSCSLCLSQQSLSATPACTHADGLRMLDSVQPLHTRRRWQVHVPSVPPPNQPGRGVLWNKLPHKVWRPLP